MSPDFSKLGAAAPKPAAPPVAAPTVVTPAVPHVPAARHTAGYHRSHDVGQHGR